MYIVVGLIVGVIIGGCLILSLRKENTPVEWSALKEKKNEV